RRALSRPHRRRQPRRQRAAGHPPARRTRRRGACPGPASTRPRHVRGDRHPHHRRIRTHPPHGRDHEMTTPHLELTVLVVGGAGGMGRHAVRTLARLEAATRILVADLDEDRARLVAGEIGPAAETVRLDATDPDAMRDAFADCDVFLNTTGPFARFGTPILRPALDAGCDYLDIDDDWQSTVEALEFDERARAEGRHVVIGLGASPGTTNVCARLAVDRLDTVDDLFTGWSLASAVVEPEDTFP